MSTKVSLQLADSCMNAKKGAKGKIMLLGNSWLGSVTTVVNLKNNLQVDFIGVVNTISNRYPKNWISDTMNNWKSGTHIILESEEVKGQRAIVMG